MHLYNVRVQAIWNQLATLSNTGKRMPVLFLGHGSPMNAIEDNDFTRALRQLSTQLPHPKAILMISAHWLTRGVRVLSSVQPPTIHDMYGFPEALYQIQYPAAGAPTWAKTVKQLVQFAEVQLDDSWGFDHGTWSVLRWIFPQADVPVFQLSIDYRKPYRWHWQLARELRALRTRGVLIIGSGNLTHNLQQIDFSGLWVPVADWALEFDQRVAEALDRGQADLLLQPERWGQAARLAIPEPSHYFPLIYAAALSDKDEPISYPYVGFHYGTLSMRCVQFG